MRHVFLLGLVSVCLVLVASLLLPACGESDDASCNALASQADSLVFDSGAELGCELDSDCHQIFQYPACSAVCGGELVSTVGMPEYASAVAAANAGPCAKWSEDACPSVGPFGCPAYPGGSTPQCIARRCVPGFEADWTSFTVQVNPASSDVLVIGQCPDGCTSWTVTPDGAITVDNDGPVDASPPAPSTPVTSLTAADLALVDDTLRDPYFRQETLTWDDPTNTDPACPESDGGAPPSDGTITLVNITRPSSSVYLNLTGCTTASNAFATLYAVLQKY